MEQHLYLCFTIEQAIVEFRSSEGDVPSSEVENVSDPGRLDQLGVLKKV